MGLCASTTSTTNDIARSISNASLHSPKTSVYRSQLTDELFNPVKRRPSTLHLQTLLETKDLRDSFAEYVKQTNSAQRKIQFWLDCHKYEMMPYEPPSVRRLFAQHLYDTYFLNTMTACRDLELDITLVRDIAQVLKINKKNRITEKSLERLRGAFVMATGRVFSDLKYMHMPRYLESQQYEDLILNNAHLHGMALQFESDVKKQKLPLYFILSRPNISGYLIAYIAKRTDGRKWLMYIDLLIMIHNLKRLS